MGSRSSRPAPPPREALILVEGETELEFYGALAERFFKERPKTIRNLKGNFNIDRNVADKIVQFHQNHPGRPFEVYVCVDQERPAYPAINVKAIHDHLSIARNFDAKKLLGLIPVVAVLMLESLFFIDMDGIYKYLRTPKAARHPEKFKNFRTLRHQDLARLFEQHGKEYRKGRRCEGLIATLNLAKIAQSADELKTMIERITKPDI